jgi:hypothetical protein
MSIMDIYASYVEGFDAIKLGLLKPSTRYKPRSQTIRAEIPIPHPPIDFCRSRKTLAPTHNPFAKPHAPYGFSGADNLQVFSR